MSSITINNNCKVQKTPEAFVIVVVVGVALRCTF